jgi:SNF2 family DNA or RNA helicase
MTKDEIIQAAVEKISQLKAGVLFMKPGTGKTNAAMRIIEGRQNDFDVVIWIAPASLLRENNYMDEVNKRKEGIYKPFYFFSIESVSQSDFAYIEIINLADKYETFCVVDESIKIKNCGSKRTKRLLQNYHKFKFRLILNGIPLSKGLIDLYAQISFISPNILKMTERQFANNFLIYKKDGYRSWNKWSKPSNESALMEMIRPYVFDADLYIDAKKQERTYTYELSSSEKYEYRLLKEQYLENKPFDYMIDFISMTQYFQHFYTMHCANKIAGFSELSYMLDGKAIVFIKFLDEIDIIKSCLRRNKKKYAILTGNQGKKTAIKEFENNADILVCTYGTGSMGLNLQLAQNVIFFSQTFDYMVKEQGIGRVYRIGQDKDCSIYDLCVNTGLENIISHSLRKKENTLTNVMNILDKKTKKEAVELL